MKVELLVVSDSDHPYSDYIEDVNLIVEDDEDRILIKLSDNEREICVNKKELLKTLKILCEE
jgi:hypothetical protein